MGSSSPPGGLALTPTGSSHTLTSRFSRLSARQFMRPITTPLLAILLVVALVVGALGGYFVASRLNGQVSQSAFVPYSDNYGGRIDDSQKGYVTSAPLVAGFASGQIAWYWLVGAT